MNNRFIIGIGSQRAGSTLLHTLLSSASNIFMHPLKELHYFDTLYGYRNYEALKSALEIRIAKIESHINKDQKTNDRLLCEIRASKILSTTQPHQAEYQDLFRPFLGRSKLLGEITPEYMLFDTKAIVAMRSLIGKDAGVILIRRDPVQRVISALKLFNVYNNLKMDNVVANNWLKHQLDSESNWIKVQDRFNDYSGAEARYSEFFPNFVKIEYENLVKDPSSVCVELESNLNIEIHKEKFTNGLSKKINQLGKDFILSEENYLTLKNRYEEIDMKK